MPLPAPTPERELLHTRTVTFKGYRRNDNLWDIEGHLTDVRSHDIAFPGVSRAAGDPIHGMWLRHSGNTPRASSFSLLAYRYFRRQYRAPLGCTKQVDKSFLT
ncbi:DUF2889 domain-containing protein [Noviherbaspirillum sedimenti]|uniref:DUF2889 domain-containing protein n=1 Tax=Noviherbaspirillum sedimenti TaxID=2320865 RepID=A0A3A3G724_9BURK|nr:DUF2889 domain-containing protein [Noviherbaspirillum sedimenti]